MYRKFPSRYGWNRPRTPGWLGWTLGIRLAAVAAVVWILATNWRG